MNKKAGLERRRMRNAVVKIIGGTLAGLVLAASAQAATISLDPLPGPGNPGIQPLTELPVFRTVNHDGPVGGTFVDRIRFNVNPGYQATFSLFYTPISVGSTLLKGIENLSFSLFNQVGGLGGGDDTAVVGCNPCSGLTFSGVLSPGGLYYAVVTGKLIGIHGGRYDVGGASVVPLPPAAWLLAAGLAGLVGIARRRKQGARAPLATAAA
jgi:hypothetical protein